MNAEIISVGTELLLGSTVDTNAAFLGEMLAECGIGCTNRQTVGDNLERLTSALELALSRSDIVVTIGGLGPTLDDMTRDGIAAALHDPLVQDPELEAAIREIFTRRNLRWVDSNSRQAMRPSCGEAIPNPNGTAPGLICRQGKKVVIALPGPPREFQPMATGPVREFLASMSGGGVIFSRTLRICGLGESRVEELVRDLMSGSNPTVAPYAKTMEVHLRVTASAGTTEEARRLIDPLEAEIRKRLEWRVFGADETTLEEAVIHALLERQQTVSVAESCTGGLLGGRLTSVAGSSGVFAGGIISYSEEVKVAQLGVSPDTLRAQSAVSEAVAQQMAEGARAKFGTDFALSITGVAGPGPDDRGNPEGLVFIGLASTDGTTVSKNQLGTGRNTIRTRATQLALTTLWERLRS